MKYIFFTLNDFLKDGGNTIRMYGIMNELAKRGHEVFLISNARDHRNFNRGIKHILIDLPVGIQEKRRIQATTAHFTFLITKYLNREVLYTIGSVFKTHELVDCSIISFEYLDNTIAYLLKKMDLISSYRNDLHGVVPLEFWAKAHYENNFFENIFYMFKYYTSEALDRKVFKTGDGFIYASKAMMEYYFAKYHWLTGRDSAILPYVLDGAEALFESYAHDYQLQEIEQLRQMGKTIIAFAGSFKKLGGVPELITAFNDLSNQYPEVQLVLIGDGETLNECRSYVIDNDLGDRVLFVGRITYSDLQSYYRVTDIIVCPDKRNMYSDLIAHAKYYDALLSGKIVLIGSFTSIKLLNEKRELAEIYNLDEKNALANSLASCIENKDRLLVKYAPNTDYVLKNFQYCTMINPTGLFPNV